ncbi:MAG: type 4a pilus biogenesis protein PilO [Candidatus Dadabacteria bacterium]|nr:type 4a pilus biogenesis protein PilO [Candidatus Dadabacteria bacterium]NIY22674.1 type 4a pilus biogenesis protein PilO [Candidatus Dadabacteria bacterium]
MAIIEDLAESINQKPPQIRLLILGVIIVILGGIFYYAFYEPKVTKIKSLQTKLQKREKLKNEYENIARELPKFEAENRRLEKEFKQASKKLPVKKEIPTLIDSVYSAVNASGLVPIAFTPGREVSKEVYFEIPIALNVTGSYFELANFFDRMAKLPRIINIRNLALKVQKTGKKKMVLNATFNAVTFRIKPVKQNQPQNRNKNKRKR